MTPGRDKTLSAASCSLLRNLHIAKQASAVGVPSHFHYGSLQRAKSAAHTVLPHGRHPWIVVCLRPFVIKCSLDMLALLASPQSIIAYSP